MARGMRPQHENELFNAVAEGDVDSIRSLIADGGDPNCRTGYGKTLLNVAISLNRAEISIILLQLGADPALQNLHNRHNALHEALEAGSDFFEYLLDHYKFDLNAATLKKETVLHIAAGKGFVSAVMRLIDEGADPLATDDGGRTPQKSALLQSAHRLEFGRPDFIECAHLLAGYEDAVTAKMKKEEENRRSAEIAARNRKRLEERSRNSRPRPFKP